jgi:hypothetical protein
MIKAIRTRWKRCEVSTGQTRRINTIFMSRDTPGVPNMGTQY